MPFRVTSCHQQQLLAGHESGSHGFRRRHSRKYAINICDLHGNRAVYQPLAPRPADNEFAGAGRRIAALHTVWAQVRLCCCPGPISGHDGCSHGIVALPGALPSCVRRSSAATSGKSPLRGRRLQRLNFGFFEIEATAGLRVWVDSNYPVGQLAGAIESHHLSKRIARSVTHRDGWPTPSSTSNQIRPGGVQSRSQTPSSRPLERT